ncbi:MAG TPA: hypothetical protein VLC92_02665 [Rhodocyclaceae bacterium]|nr:hypothetical protein [Rhodocyclaceae bacterium]
MSASSKSSKSKVSEAAAVLSHNDLSLIGSAYVAGLESRFGSAVIAPTEERIEPKKPTCIHEIPLMPIHLDGKRAAPESVKDFDGKPLIYVLDERARDGDELQVFTNATKAKQHALILSPRAKAKKPAGAPRSLAASIGTSSTPQQIANVIGGSVFLWEHISFSGWQWRFGAGTTSSTGGRQAGNGNIPDFRNAIFLQNINDKVSSVSNQSEVWANVRPQRSFVILHQHINFLGAQLWVPERQAFPDLRQFGWNDTASSLSYALV